MVNTVHKHPLERVATLCDHADELARTAGLLADSDSVKTEDMASRASQKLQEAVAILSDLGYRPSGQPLPLKEKNPLAELARMENSRPQAFALLETLRAALSRAEALDLARGDVLDAPVLGSRGLVWGEEMVQMIARLELELYGPGAGVTGGRE